MSSLSEQITSIKALFLSALQKTETLDALEQFRIMFLGRTGKITALMRQLKHLSKEQKQTYGPLLNRFKKEAEQAYKEKKVLLTKKTLQKAEARSKYFDVTGSNTPHIKGGIHLNNRIVWDLEDIFISMGYQIVDGPELETDYYNFQALNIPSDHPARDMMDTFWVDKTKHLLRTHTSCMEIRALEKQPLPLAIFAPGRVYRHEATDASHDFVFWQAEALVVDRNISMAHLLATTETFLKKIFAKEYIETRIRPGYFPFVEPGIEIDIKCIFCSNGCSVCKKTTWIELLGAGLTHPHVLSSCNIDPEIYSGFAFGFGIERLAMIKHNINDIRLFKSVDLHFLQQF